MSTDYRFISFFKLIIALIARLTIIGGLVALGMYWNRLFEALLVLVAIFQFELAYRQYWFNKVRNEPIFAVYTMEVQGKKSIHITIENVGPTPAYLLGVSRVLCNNTPLSPEEWKQYVKAPRHSCLKPISGSATLAIIPKSFFEERFAKGKYVIEVSYVNCFGEWKDFLVTFSELTPTIVTGTERLPGFFLSIGDYIAVIKALRELHRLVKK